MTDTIRQNCAEYRFTASATRKIVTDSRGRGVFRSGIHAGCNRIECVYPRNEEQRMIAGLIYIDNYDEVMESVEEVRQSLLVALIDRKINKYIGDVDGIVKKWRRTNIYCSSQICLQK